MAGTSVAVEVMVPRATVPCVVPLDGDREAELEGERDADGESEAEGLSESEAEAEGLSEEL